MKEQNIYQKQAAQETLKIIRVTTHKFQSDEYQGPYRMETRGGRLCKVNGEKYITAGSIFHGFVSRIKTIVSRGLMTTDDFYYFYGGERVNCFVKVSTVERIKNELTKQFMDKWKTSLSTIPVINKAVSVDIPNEVFPQDEVDESTRAYHRRNVLLAKSKEYNAEQGRRIEAEYERKQEEERIEREKNEEKTLRSLVSQIEAMGWHVSLTLKDNG